MEKETRGILRETIKESTALRECIKQHRDTTNDYLETRRRVKIMGRIQPQKQSFLMVRDTPKGDACKSLSESDRKSHIARQRKIVTL